MRNNVNSIRKSTSLVAFSAAVLLASATAWAGDGSVNFNGELITAGCDVAPGSESQIVDLGTLSVGSFKGAGTVAGARNFQVTLKNCDASLSSVSIIFDGQPSEVGPTVLAIQGAGSAAGVGIALYEGDGTTPIALHAPTKPVDVGEDKGVIMHFVAKYKSTTEVVTAGKVNASASFTVVYN